MQNSDFKIILRPLVVFLITLLMGGCAGKIEFKKDVVPAAYLNLVVDEVRSEYLPYKEFCLRNSGECNMIGPTMVEYSDQIQLLLIQINTMVNHEIEFALDIDEYQQEEFWAYPRSGRGDCEDIALEKRARLVQFGLPRGALTIAIVRDRRSLSSHAVLLAETTHGTYLLDSVIDQVSLWCQLPYNYESRERPDGKWERFDQNVWVFD